MYCNTHSAVKDAGDYKLAVSLPCRAWTCPTCCEDRRRQLIATAIAGKPNTFITATIRRRPDSDPNHAALQLSRAWRLLRLRALREATRRIDKKPEPFGAAPPDGWKPNAQGIVTRKVQLTNGKLPFIAIVEKHQSGWPHLHILARSIWLDWQWLSAQMRDIIDSPHIDVQRITKASQAAGYCAKYAGKAAEKFATCKRYWQSPDYQLEKFRRDDAVSRSGSPWDHRSTHLMDLYQNLRDTGHMIVWRKGWCFEYRPPPWGPMW